MKILEKRIKNVEDAVIKTEGLTVEDLMAIFDCMPKEIADEIKKAMSAILAGDRPMPPRKIEPRRKTLQDIANTLPPEVAAKMREKFGMTDVDGEKAR
jgi:hypothetical protein